MQKGIAVVHYDCKGIKVLPECSPGGSYGFARIPYATEERIIEENDDLSATIPIAAASIGAEISRGLKLRLKYAFVGRKGGRVENEVARDSLKGTCEGATHFVRAALVGAFQFGTATEGKVGANAKVLGAGTEGESKSARQMNREAGNVDACKAGGDDGAPPKDCEHLVQLQLGPVVGATQGGDDPVDGEQAAAKAAAASNPCSDGFVLAANGQCKKKSSAGAHLCKPDDVSDCAAQCEKGSAESCHNAGRGQYKKDLHPTFDAARTAALKFYEKGCTAKFWPSCGAQASLVAFGKDADRAQAKELFKRGCDGGDSSSCLALASDADSGTLAEDRSKFQAQPVAGFKLTEKACNLGSGYACAMLGRRYIEGKGVMANAGEGQKALQKGCESGTTSACVEWARYLATGDAGVKKDPKKALQLFDTACSKNNYASACIGAAELSLKGDGAKKGAGEAKKYLEHACSNLNSGRACVSLGELVMKGELGEKDPAQALKLYEKACPSGKAFPTDGCYGAAVLYEKGDKGISKKPELAAELYARACMPFDAEKTGNPEKACKKALASLDAIQSESDRRRVASVGCFPYKDKKACELVKKLGSKPGAGKAPPPPPGGKSPGPPPPPPAGLKK